VEVSPTVYKNYIIWNVAQSGVNSPQWNPILVRISLSLFLEGDLNSFKAILFNFPEQQSDKLYYNNLLYDTINVIVLLYCGFGIVGLWDVGFEFWLQLNEALLLHIPQSGEFELFNCVKLCIRLVICIEDCYLINMIVFFRFVIFNLNA
jgi:hypothetical protein